MNHQIKFDFLFREKTMVQIFFEFFLGLDPWCLFNQSPFFVYVVPKLWGVSRATSPSDLDFSIKSSNSFNNNFDKVFLESYSLSNWFKSFTCFEKLCAHTTRLTSLILSCLLLSFTNFNILSCFFSYFFEQGVTEILHGFLVQ